MKLFLLSILTVSLVSALTLPPVLTPDSVIAGSNITVTVKASGKAVRIAGNGTDTATVKAWIRDSLNRYDASLTTGNCAAFGPKLGVRRFRNFFAPTWRPYTDLQAPAKLYISATRSSTQNPHLIVFRDLGRTDTASVGLYGDTASQELGNAGTVSFQAYGADGYAGTVELYDVFSGSDSSFDTITAGAMCEVNYKIAVATPTSVAYPGAMVPIASTTGAIKDFISNFMWKSWTGVPIYAVYGGDYADFGLTSYSDAGLSTTIGCTGEVESPVDPAGFVRDTILAIYNQCSDIPNADTVGWFTVKAGYKATVANADTVKFVRGAPELLTTHDYVKTVDDYSRICGQISYGKYGRLRNAFSNLKLKTWNGQPIYVDYIEGNEYFSYVPDFFDNTNLAFGYISESLVTSGTFNILDFQHGTVIGSIEWNGNDPFDARGSDTASISPTPGCFVPNNTLQATGRGVFFYDTNGNLGNATPIPNTVNHFVETFNYVSTEADIQFPHVYEHPGDLIITCNNDGAASNSISIIPNNEFDGTTEKIDGVNAISGAFNFVCPVNDGGSNGSATYVFHPDPEHNNWISQGYNSSSNPGNVFQNGVNIFGDAVLNDLGTTGVQTVCIDHSTHKLVICP